MIKRLIVAVLAMTVLAVGGTTVADAAKAKKKHAFTGTAELRVLKTSGSLVTQTGTIKFKGIGNGALVAIASPSGDHFNYVGIAYFGNGTLRVSGTNKATANADGSTSYAGTFKVNGGTGAGKTWKGTGTITGTATKDDPTYSTYTVKATVTY